MKRKETNLSVKGRKMFLTINNPHKIGTIPNNALIPKGILTGAVYDNNEDAKTALVNIVKNYIENSNIMKGKTEVYYCFSVEVGSKGETPHIHIFFLFENGRYGNSIKKVFPTSHIDYCNDTPQGCRNYVFKCGKWENSEKEDTRINGTQYENSTLPENFGQGKRTDLETIKDLIDSGMTPQAVLDTNANFYRLENFIRKMYFDKRKKETPVKRDVEVVVHTGVAGSGKSNTMTKIDENNMFIATDYSTALFDNYCGEEHLFMDEFRGQMPYNQLLTVLDGYKVPVHARYSNVLSVWNYIHITSVVPLEDWYCNDNIRDTLEQLKRRVTKIVFHFMTYNNVYIPDKVEFLRDHDKSEIEYHEYTINAAQYVDYEKLEKEALEAAGITMRYNSALEETPFNNSLADEYIEWLKVRGWEESASAFAEFWTWKTEQIKTAAENAA